MVSVRPTQTPLANAVFFIGTKARAADSWSYPFRVNGDGSCSATKFTISGDSTFSGALSSATGSVSGITLTGTSTNSGKISGGTISGGTLSNSTGGTYVGTCSGSSLSSCTLNGTTLTTGGANGSFYSDNNQAYVSGNSVQLKSSGTGFLVVHSGGVSITGGLTVSREFSCSGEKSRVIKTQNFGERRLHAFETPTPTFSDYGTAALDETGVFNIVVNPIFAETVKGIGTTRGTAAMIYQFIIGST